MTQIEQLNVRGSLHAVSKELTNFALFSIFYIYKSAVVKFCDDMETVQVKPLRRILASP